MRGPKGVQGPKGDHGPKGQKGQSGNSCVALKLEATNHPNRRYKEFGGRCYLFVPHMTGMLWKSDNEKARDYCQGFGADLVALETSSEYEFIKRVIDVEEKDMPNSGSNWILGGKRTGVGNKFIWVQTGRPIGFANWQTGGVNVPGSHASENNVYVFMGLRTDSRGDRSWWVNPNASQRKNIICESS